MDQRGFRISIGTKERREKGTMRIYLVNGVIYGHANETDRSAGTSGRNTGRIETGYR